MYFSNKTIGNAIKIWNNDAFYRRPVTSAQCITGTEIYPDSAILLNYNDDYFSQGYGQVKEAFKALTKETILRPNISEDDFRSPSVGDNIGYNIHSFNIRYQKILKALHRLTWNLDFRNNFPLAFMVTLQFQKIGWLA